MRVVCMAMAVAATTAVAGCGAGATSTPERRAPAIGSAPEVEARFAGIPQGGTALGSPSAPVTLVEFGDLQCPFCRRFDRDVLPDLLRRYVRRGQLRIDFRPLALLGADSGRAARAALAAAEQNRLWQFIGLFYENQRRENSGYVTDAFVRSLAAEVGGLDPARLLRVRGSVPVEAQLAANTRLARRLGVRGTPTFLVGRSGGTMSRFVAPADARLFRRIVDRVLAREA